jgi:hypothetical protein
MGLTVQSEKRSKTTSFDVNREVIDLLQCVSIVLPRDVLHASKCSTCAADFSSLSSPCRVSHRATAESGKASFLSFLVVVRLPYLRVDGSAAVSLQVHVSSPSRRYDDEVC